MSRTSACILAATISIWPVLNANANEALSYVYQRGGAGQAGTTHVELEGAVGTREARPFGERGLESGARLRYAVTDRVSVEAWGGVLFDDGRYENAGYDLQASIAILEQRGGLADLEVGAGFKRDFTGTYIPHVQASAHRGWERFDLGVTGMAEVPLAENRDAVDLVVGIAASYQVLPRLRLGGELVGEDIEGLWDEEEAEGGARVVVGPTARLGLSDHFAVRANAGGIIAASTSTLPAQEGQQTASSRTGFLGRVVIAYVF